MKWTKRFSKKEKEHIKYVIESLVYIISIIVVIFANIYGPIYIKMMPLLFILGIVGNIVFNRAFITALFGLIVSICLNKISGINLTENLLYSFLAFMYIALGEICGIFFIKIKKYLKKKKYMYTKEAIVTYISTLVVIGFVLVSNNYINSNIFKLSSCKDRLNDYLKEKYSTTKFEILAQRYNFIGDDYFKFVVKDLNTNRLYNFSIYTDERLDIYDGILESKIYTYEKKIKEEFENYIKQKDVEKKYSEISYEIAVPEENVVELRIKKEVYDIADSTILGFSTNVADFLNDLKDFEYMKDIKQTLLVLESQNKEQKNIVSYIYMDRFNDNKALNVEEDYEYIKKALNVEYID